MRRRESLVGQVVAINVLLVVAVLFAASAAAGLDLAVNDERLRLGAIALSIVLLLAANMLLLRRPFSPLHDRLARQLRPAALDDLGLIAAIEGQLARFSDQTGIQAVLSAEGAPEAITEDQQTVIYRVVQEALSNTAQHSGATFVAFELRVFPSHGVELRVRDNGKGFDSTDDRDTDDGIGLSGMAERALLVGGELTVASAPGTGTRVRLYIPQ